MFGVYIILLKSQVKRKHEPRFFSAYQHKRLYLTSVFYFDILSYLRYNYKIMSFFALILFLYIFRLKNLLFLSYYIYWGNEK